jgi:hypothetical protein
MRNSYPEIPRNIYKLLETHKEFLQNLENA